MTKEKSITGAVYGYCPNCGSKGVTRERRPNGNDSCEKGCIYPSATAVHKDITGGEVEEPALIFPDHQADVSDDLLFRLEYWGNFDYKTGCEYAHQILLDYRDVIYSVLERAKSGHLKTTGEDAWRPISEAPNEGVSFLVWAKHRTDNEFSVIQASWFEGRLYADSKESIIDFEDGLQATHWMPLPAAPGEKE